jgi:ribosomal protein L21E
MKTRTLLQTLTVFCLAATVCLASPHMGTWKLNEAKSKIPGMAKNITVAYTADGDNVKVTIDGTDDKGKPTHNTWTGKFDGKDYAVTGDSESDMRSYKMVNDRTLDFAAKKAGTTTITGQIVVAEDGKSRTVTTNGKDDKGKEIKVVAVYDKQ